MQIVTVDFETYYSNQVGFKKQTNEEYLRDPQFEVIGVGIKIDEGKTKWVTGKAVHAALQEIDWANSAVLCHNTMFDGAILAWHYNIVPAMYYDTLCMARAIHGVDAGGSLEALASKYAIGEKGNEVINALGKRLCDFDDASLARYGEYCINDVDLTYTLFHKLQPFPEDELKLIDITLRMYTQPMLQVNDALLIDRLDTIRNTKKEMLADLMEYLECEDEEGVRKKLASNKQFAELLKPFDITPPMKISPTTGKQTLALAKTDEGFIALQEHENPIVQQLCAVRLGTKSTLEESRIERFIEIGSRNRTYLPVPLRYYGAHTGRWSGLDSINFQNLPSRDKSKKALKNAVIAPDKHIIVNCDSSQIEARVLAWLAEQDDVTDAFANKRDVYCEFATKVYKRPITKAEPIERFVGKTCILGLGYGTGANKLQHTLKTQPPGADLSIDECRSIVNLYRTENSRITGLWRECDNALKQMMDKASRGGALGNGAVTYSPEGIRLPNGLYIRYPNLRYNDEGKMVYDSRKGVVNIWGGAMVENIVQALARIVVGKQMIWISEHYRPVLTVHDAAVCIVPENDVKSALEYITLCMSTPPSWARGLPVACEAKYGRSYGEC